MQNNSGFTLDNRDFNMRFKNVTEKQIPDAGAQAFREVAPIILADAIKLEPRAPHDTGNLWRSQKVDVPKIRQNEITVDLGFNADYAAKVHEMPDTTAWKMPGAGPKYLEAKFMMRGHDYFQMIADKIKAKGTARDI